MYICVFRYGECPKYLQNMLLHICQCNSRDIYCLIEVIFMLLRWLVVKSKYKFCLVPD